MFEKNIEKKVINEEEVKEMKYILIEGKIISKKGYGDYEKSESYHIINLEGENFFEYDNIYIGNCLCQKIYISDVLSNQKKEKERLLTENGYDINYLSMPYDCEYCKDSGLLEDGSKCYCLNKLIIDKLYKTSNLDHTLKKENFLSEVDDKIFINLKKIDPYLEKLGET